MRAIDVEGATVHKLPCQNRVVATCSNPNFQCLVYKDARGDFLVIAANLSMETVETMERLLLGHCVVITMGSGGNSRATTRFKTRSEGVLFECAIPKQQ